MTEQNKIMKELAEAKAFLMKKVPAFPKVFVVLGSGLSQVLENMDIETEVSFGEIPHFKELSVEGHVGKLVVGKLGSTRVVCMRGRLHYYEGHTMLEVVFPFRACALAGAEVFILTNAAGGAHKEMGPGSFVLIQDHLNMTGTNPLIGQNLDDLGVRFPDSSSLYDPELRLLVESVSKEIGVPVKKGIYCGVHGPSYETPAEVRAFRKLGADVTGMSTVPETIALSHMGKRVVGISCVTNYASGVSTEPQTHDEVLETAKRVQGEFARLITAVVNKLGE